MTHLQDEALLVVLQPGQTLLVEGLRTVAIGLQYKHKWQLIG